MFSCQLCCEKTYRKVTHVIFDLDGTLLDSEMYSKQAYADVCADYGKVYSDEVRQSHIGVPTDAGCRMVVDALKINASVSEFKQKVMDKLLVTIGGSKLIPAAEKLVRHLHDNNVLIAIATSSGKEDFDVKYQANVDFYKLFHHFVLGVDPEVKQGKPSPDIYLAAAKRFPESPKPEDCLVIEDAPNGVQAALSAGMQCVMVPGPEIPKEKQHSTLVLKSLDDFVPEQFGLPGFGAPSSKKSESNIGTDVQLSENNFIN